MHLESDGTYNVFVNNQLWLTSAATFFRTNGISYSTSNGLLEQIGEPRAIAGNDVFGLWTGETLSYSADGLKVSVSVRTYAAADDDGGKLAIFTQVDCFVFDVVVL